MVDGLGPEVDEIRRVHDPHAMKGGRPHITLLFPFAPYPAVTEDIRERLQEIFSAHRPFEVTVGGVCGFPGVIYLGVTPHAPLHALMADLVREFPDYPPYGSKWDTLPVPHLTLGHASDVGEAAILAEDCRQRLAGLMPRTVSCTRVHLCRFDGTRWDLREPFDLG